MNLRFRQPFSVASVIVALGVAACTPAAPAPTVAPAKPAPTAAPAPAPTAAPAPKPTAAPAASPAAAKPAPTAEPKPVVDDFFKGRTVKIIVGLPPGGGYDTYARLIARYLGKHIPGTPNVIVENQPGAGSLVAANAVYATAPKDGTTMVHFTGGHIVQQAIGNKAVQFDSTKYVWLGAASSDSPACAATKVSGFNRLDEATGSREIILGGSAPGAVDVDLPNVVKRVLGLNIKLIAGYQGTGPTRLAAENGETHGACWAWESMKPTWKDNLASGAVKVIAQGTRKPHPDLPNVQVIRDLARTDEQRQLIDGGITLPAEFARPFALPPGVPAGRVQVLREAFMATLKDSDLLADAAKSQVVISPLTGEQIEQSVKEVFALPPALLEKLKAALGEG